MNSSMAFSVFPWNLKSWRSAFSVAGLPGIALFCLLLGAMLQVEDLSGGGAGHSSAAAILLIRTPAIVIAFLMLLFKPRIAPMRDTDLRLALCRVRRALLSFDPVVADSHPDPRARARNCCWPVWCFSKHRAGENAIARIEGLRQITLLVMSLLGSLAVIGFCFRLTPSSRTGQVSSAARPRRRRSFRGMASDTSPAR